MLFDTEGRPPPGGYAARGPAFIAVRSEHEISDGRGYSSGRESERQRPAFGEQGAEGRGVLESCFGWDA